MDDPLPAAKRSRGVVLAALLGLIIVLGALAYFYFDGLNNFVQSVANGKTGPAHGHIRY